MNPCPKPERIKSPELIKSVSQQRCVAHVDCIGEVCAHHVTSKGAGGDDIHENLMPACRRHHDLIHRHGNRWMCENFPMVRQWLEHHNRWDILDKIDQLEFNDSEKLRIR